MSALIGKLVAGAGSVLWGWTIYALTDWGLSSLFDPVALPQTHRASLDAVAAVAFIIALWGTDVFRVLETRPTIQSKAETGVSFNEMFAAQQEAAKLVAKELEPDLTAAVTTAVNDALRPKRWD
jgi:hypothetical protein